MLWLIITISAYFLFAVVALIDKYLLTGFLLNPKVYSFYVGILGILALVLIPFGFLIIPEISLILLAFLAGTLRIFAIFFFFTALKNFEASRVVPAIGGILPLVTFGLTYLAAGKRFLIIEELIAFTLLLAGSFLISFEKEKLMTIKSLRTSSLAAFFSGLSLFFSKFVYLKQPFLSGFIWVMMGSGLTSIFLLFSKEVRKEIFKNKEFLRQKTFSIFLTNQTMGASAFILQNWAIALAPLIYLPIINVLQGTQYVFVLAFAIFISLMFPKILKEEISKKILFQKLLAVFLIAIGLGILALS